MTKTKTKFNGCEFTDYLVENNLIGNPVDDGSDEINLIRIDLLNIDREIVGEAAVDSGLFTIKFHQSPAFIIDGCKVPRPLMCDCSKGKSNSEIAECMEGLYAGNPNWNGKCGYQE